MLARCVLLLILGVASARLAETAMAADARFETAPCPRLSVKALSGARCGYLVVPENRGRLEDRKSTRLNSSH